MAADDVKSRKRKGAGEVAPKPKKPRKSNDATALDSSADALAAEVDPIEELPVAVKVVLEQPKEKGKKGKKSKAAEEVPVVAPELDVKAVKEKTKKGKTTKVGVEVTLPVSEVTVEAPKEKTKKAKKTKVGAEETLPEPEAAVEASKENKKNKKKAKKGTEEQLIVPSPPDAAEVAPKSEKSKRPRKGKTDDIGDPAPPKTDKSVTSEGKASKKTKASKKQEEQQEADSDVDELDEDDQTAALLAGFESDGDASDLEKEDEEHDVDQLVAKIPSGLIPELTAASKHEDASGVIFVGRIPHGFYESQMKAYFSQFGKVNQLRLSRNKKTGASKHYAFVEFASAEVAEIVARTMDKYLMFGHILQCNVIPPEQVHPNLFAGANKRFKTVPRNKMAGNEMARGAERAVWEKRVAKETKHRASKNKKLKEQLGYEFTAPELKAVEDVPKKALAIEDGAEQQLLLETPVQVTETIQAIESTPGQISVTETVIKKSKKGSKRKIEDVQQHEEAEPEPAVEKKSKRSQKTKADAVIPVEALEQSSTADQAPPVKKSKKTKAGVAIEDKVEGGDEASKVEEPPRTKKAKKSGKIDADAGDLTMEKKRKAVSADTGSAKAKKSKKAKD